MAHTKMFQEYLLLFLFRFIDVCNFQRKMFYTKICRFVISQWINVHTCGYSGSRENISVLRTQCCNNLRGYVVPSVTFALGIESP